MTRPRINKRYVIILRWGIPTILASIVLGAASSLLSKRDDPAAANEDGSIDGLTSKLERTASEAMLRSIRFEDVTDASGIRFRHFPDTRRSLLPEDMGSGVAWGDYDDDGDPDLFLVNFASSVSGAASAAPEAGRCRLYRNDNGGTRFVDVSDASGLGLRLHGLGACWADYDNDRDLDLHITCFGPNRLLRNNGDGTFTDVSEEAGIAGDAFSAGSSWADFDRDGDLDLYVCNYVDFVFDPEEARSSSRQYETEIPSTINPSSYAAVANRLYRNRGDGSFEDCAVEAGVDNPEGRSLEASWFDFDHDGWIDLYVANDVSSNGVYRNLGDGTFEDIGARSLAADYRGAMGLAVGDLDRDSDLDLFVTHWLAQENACFINRCSDERASGGPLRLMFMDDAEPLGLGYISLHTVGWATGFVDFDNDGWADLWVANGNTLERSDDSTLLKPQHAHVFRRDIERGFFELGASTCSELGEAFVGRGGASADFDRDGRVDLVLIRHGGPPLLLRNTSDNDHHWVSFDLRQGDRNHRAVGARIVVHAASLSTGAQVGADASYLSQHDTVLHFGLGSADHVDELVIHWPDGTVETRTNLAANRVHTIVRRDRPDHASTH